MRAYQFSSSAPLEGVYGAAIGIEQVERDAGQPGPGAVQVAVKANALNFVDLITLQGAFPVDGRIPLLDGAGEVIAVGDGVTRFAVGDRVVANPHANWLAGPPTPDTTGLVLGIMADGMLAETVTLAESMLVHLPDAISFTQGASLPCAGLSAWSSLVGGPSRYSVAPGSTVLTQGTGGVSLFAVQFAKAMGCRVIATTSTAAKAERLKALGADHVINYNERPDWGVAVLELTGGIGADLVVEVGGPNTLPQSIIAAKVGGRIAMVGIVGGMGSIDFMQMLPINHKVLTLYANGMGNRQDLVDMLRFVEANAIEPVIDSTFTFDQAADAYRHFASRGHIGKVLITHPA
ncbi:putative oxidoreductase [Caenibius tardaugens NBRC 16725]|uniref:Putative oxidoreductase n=1 Tax=Caenibius tardaugens NBRC 16725 TaxID=1219035 RepID=U2ZRE6_9SPHN|nr:NAD(P)-dependent alcohol dehydrogenase [Caenibius tardaugens]AZI37964.1 NAD(P)-dependent alcohol dehydrogenase [Caenibius tardaugens NBRC 16725]GAD47934.1 putative oxidoreductase [Caenibius tardaugens NBRC 16725]